MYRNKRTGGFKPPVMNLQSTSKSDLEKTDPPEQGSMSNPVRSTTRILSLFKKPLKDNDEEKVKKKDSIESANDDKIDVKENSAPVNTNNKLIFNVVIGKKSTRKHKVWDDDGILEVCGKTAILKDTEGNILKRTTVNSDSLEEGFRMCIDSKEIEIVDRVLGEVSSTSNSIRETVQEPPPKKLKSSFVSPLATPSLKKGLKPPCEPLVMPPLITAKGWCDQDPREKEEEVSVDYCLASVLRPHQRYGVVFLYECLMGLKVPNHFGAILADEMGLGKTLQCITIVWTLLKKGPSGKPTLKRVLVVSPSSLCNNWGKEFLRWLGYHRIVPYIVDAKNKPGDFRKHCRNAVMIISYEMLVKNYDEVERLGFDLMICDEGHRLKNNEIKAAKFLQSMNCKKRILLTGTPIQNDLREFFALADFVNPGILGTNSEYKNYYEEPIVASQCPHATPAVIALGKERATQLHEKTKTFILRRTQETINKYLPPKYELIVFCALSPEQRYLYSLVTDTWFSKTVVPENGVPHLAVITALKKICNHPDLFKGEKNNYFQTDSTKLSEALQNRNMQNSSRKNYCGKVTVVQTLMRSLKNTDEKLVLISYFTQTLDLLENVCNCERTKFLRLDGSTSSALRSKIVEQFNSPTDDHKVFLLSAKAGGVGLNLPGASRLVLFDSDWNPASDSQAMARIWREGQRKNVYIYRLLTTGTIEEKIFQRQISKAGLSETVVDVNHLTSLKLSISELKDLFTLRTDTNCATHDLMNCPCDGEKRDKMSSEESEIKDTREYQFTLEDDPLRQNLTINQLLEWEHHKNPISNDTMKEIMLTDVSEEITFLFKNSVLR